MTDLKYLKYNLKNNMTHCQYSRYKNILKDETLDDVRGIRKAVKFKL